MLMVRLVPTVVAFSLLLASSVAEAQEISRIDVQPNQGVQPNHPSMVQSRLSFICYGAPERGNDDITGQGTCGQLSSCNPGTVCGLGSQPAYYRVDFVPGASNEEKIGAYCQSDVLGDPIREFCLDEPMVATIRMKVRELRINLIGNDNFRPFIQSSGFNLRFPVGNQGRYYQTGPEGGWLPIGSWTPVVNGAAERHCKPVPVNTSPVFVVEEGTGVQEVDWFWRGTLCQITVLSSTGGGTIVDLGSDYSCPMPAGEETLCEFEVPFNETARVQAVGDPGFVGELARIGGPCAFSEPDPTICQWIPEGDRPLDVDWEPVSTSATMTASAGSSVPAGGVVAKGSSGVAVHHVHVEATGAPAINNVIVTMGGTGAAQDLAGVKVYVDANGNGAVDGGEALAGQAEMATTGAVGISFASPLAVGSGVDLLVTVDIDETIQAGVRVPGAPWTLLLVIAIPLAVLFRRRAPAMAVAIVAVAVATSLACGSSDNGGNDNGDNGQQSDSDNADNDDTDDDSTDDDGDVDPNPTAKTYVFGISSITGTETVSGGPAVVATGTPIAGATISVMP